MSAAALEETRRAQLAASDPMACAWVSANAGSGKTYVLVRRVLRCLLDGAAPETILCLTFTKAAAAEMSNRLMQELGRWAAAPEEALDKTLADVLGRAAEAGERAVARGLFARALDAPGGLNIMTIHSFCDRVLRRFPLEGGLAPGFTVMTEEEAADALREACEAALSQAAKGDDEALAAALNAVSARTTEDGFAGLMKDALKRKAQIQALLTEKLSAASFAALANRMKRAFGLEGAENAAVLRERQLRVVTDATCHAASALSAFAKTDCSLVGKLAEALNAKTEAGRRDALREAFLTKEGQARGTFITKAACAALPALAETLIAARDEFAALEAKANAAATVEATIALLRLAHAAIEIYERRKRDAGAADYHNLIHNTLALLTRQGAEWVLYQLDTRVRHILIDEAQDTNAEQWRIVSLLADDFFSGESAAGQFRSIFAVGDEKQSIFGFQGAEPRRFREMGALFSGRARAAAAPWRDVPLNVSFRSAAPVLRAVDLAFAGVSGLQAEASATAHIASRQGEAGVVELWPPFAAAQADQGDAWRPLDDDAAEVPPAQQLATAMANCIRGWLDRGEMLASQGRPIRASDILILLRKREPFAPLIIRACQERGVPIAGADRLKLAGQLAVLDLLRLGDFLLQPADDLALACVLKSPFFDWTDDGLFAVAYGRAGALWDALREHEGVATQRAAATLNRWREAAMSTPPFDFFAGLLDAQGYRRRFVERLGPEADDALNELLTIALAYEQRFTPALQGFLHYARNTAAEVKRDAGAERDEVRVMTVHGAKGLEANIVFLADTCSTKSRSASALLDIADDFPGAPLLCWGIPAAKHLTPVQAAREGVKAEEGNEYKRLLYVAMTRARDRLYVTGFEGARGRDKECWYDLVSSGLHGHAVEANGLPGRVLRLVSEQTLTAPAGRSITDRPLSPLPAWITTQINEPAPARLRPSAAVEHDKSGGEGAAPGQAVLRGVLTHALLQFLPAAPKNEWIAAGARYLDVHGAALPAPLRREILDEALAVLEAPSLAELWGPRSRAEIPFELTLNVGGAPLSVSGQIDRLIVTDHEVLIVDFKTGRSVPAIVGDTPLHYAAQLAIYRLAVQKIFPGKPLRAAILWTAAPLLTLLPGVMLDAALVDAFRPAGEGLDGDPRQS